MKFLELARMTTATTGTGTVTLGSAVTGNLSFATAGAVTGDVISYGISDGAASEIGWGVYNSTGPTLTRNLINSTTGSLISLSGNAEIFATVRPSDLICASAGGGVGGPPMYNGTLSVTASGSALTIALKTLAGTDPTNADPVDFFFPTDTGSYSVIRHAAAMSLVVPSTAFLGVNALTPFRLWFTAFNDSGTVRLGVICCSTPGIPGQPFYPLNDGTESSTVMSTASDLGGVIYTGTAVTSKPMRIIGYAEWNASGLSAQGTWTVTNMTAVRLFGPGVAKPGEVVQVAQVSDVTTTSAVATTSFTATGLTKSFTRKSICNIVRAEAYGVLGSNIGSMVTSARLYKSNSAITNGSVAEIADDSLTAGVLQRIPASLLAYDFPTAGGANPATIDVKINNSNTTGTGTWNPGATVTLMVLTELQV